MNHFVQKNESTRLDTAKAYMYVHQWFEQSQPEKQLTGIFRLRQVANGMDWRQYGVVTDVKNQGQCSSSWAFATTGALEGAWALAGNSLTSFSEQQLVDCSRSYGNQGCSGGLMDAAYE